MAPRQCTVVSPEDIKGMTVYDLSLKALNSPNFCIEVKKDSDSVTLDQFAVSTSWDFHSNNDYFKM